MKKRLFQTKFILLLALVIEAVNGGIQLSEEDLGHRTNVLLDMSTWNGGSPLLSLDSSPTFFQNPLHSLRFYRGVYEIQNPFKGSETNTSSAYSRGYGNAIYHCSRNGFFLKTGSCRDYYQCEKLNGEKEFLVYDIFCPPGSAFDSTSKACILPVKASTHFQCGTDGIVTFAHKGSSNLEYKYLTENNGRDIFPLESLSMESLPTLRRQKRAFPFALLFGGLSALGSLAGASSAIAGSVLANKKTHGDAQGTGGGLQNIEYQLQGIDGKMKNVQLSVLESQVENRINSNIIKNLISKGTENNQLGFEETQKLINQGILENRFNTAKTQGLITQSNLANQLNFAKVQVSISQLKRLVSQEINNAKSEIRIGFESLSSSIDQTRIEPLLSNLLTLITEFRQKTNHVRNLPKQNRRDEIERSGGYITYLESSTLQNTLYDIIQQNFAIPKDSSDVQAVFILDLLVHGLQVHAHMLSAIVSSNAYLAGESLEDRNLEEFNTYMLRVSSSIERIKLALVNSGGLLEEVRKILDTVQQLSHATNIRGLRELIHVKRDELDHLNANVTTLITDNTELSTPSKIQGKPNFAPSNVPVPTGPWKVNTKVRYAVQFVSENGLSRIGEWSAPYTITDRGCPIIQLPTVASGLTRLIYRRFNDEKPELIAVISDNAQKEFRDIGRDLLSAVSTQNEDIALRETTTLLNNGADVNVWIENEMTPLHYAAKHGNIHVMKLLVERGANVQLKSKDNQDAIHFAALFGTEEGIDHLISKGADVNAQTRLLGLSSLHIAVVNSHVSATKALMRNNAFINIKDNYGLTPLHLSTVGNGDTIDELLKSTTLDVNAIDEDGLTPLHYAARSSNKIIISKLLSHEDIDVNARTKFLLTPLHFASMSGNSEVIPGLLREGADISAADEDGSTPLHYAAFYGNRKAVLELIKQDNLLETVKNNEGKTAFDLATENDRHSVIEVLGKDVNTLVDIIRNELQDEPTNEVNTNKANEDRPSNCTDVLIQEMVNGSEETCEHIQNVEAYVNLVMSMIPLKKYYENREDFSEIFANYDNDLHTAQERAKIWRNGDSIVSGIRQTFELAKEFEPEFTRKYQINQKRVEMVKKNVDQAKLINQTKDDIQKMELELQDLHEAKTEVINPKLLPYFENQITELQTSLQEKQRMLREDFSLIPELEELIDFLEFVRRDSTKIREMAIRTRNKTEIFRDNLEQDKNAFIRHGRVAKTAFDRLQNETIEKNKELFELKKKQDELEKNIEAEKQRVEEHYAKIQESHKELREMKKKLMDKMDKASKMGIAGAIVSIFVPIVGIPLLLVANKEQNDAAQLSQSAMETNRLEMDLLNTQIKSSYNQIDNYRQLVANSSSNSDKIRLEMNVFNTLDGDLQTLSSEVDKLLEAIEKAITGVKLIKNVFDDVTKKLGEMIDVAKTAKTEAERLNAKYFLYHELSLLQCNWQDVYHKVMNLDDCTRYFQILY